MWIRNVNDLELSRHEEVAETMLSPGLNRVGEAEANVSTKRTRRASPG